MGKVRNQIIITAKMTKDMAKSTVGDKMPEIGRRSRGKYIFEISWAFPTTLSVPRVREVAKRFQGSRAEYVKMGYGTPSDGILAKLPKTAVKRAIVIKG